jgi:hypothetical protein
MQLKIRSAIVCDFVRTEDTGKHILIGVYTGDIIFARFPATFSPTYWLDLKPSVRDAEIEVEAKIDVPGAKKPIIGTLKMNVGQQDTGILVLSVPPIQITAPGKLQFSIRSKGERWTRALSKEVRLKESASPSA